MGNSKNSVTIVQIRHLLLIVTAIVCLPGVWAQDIRNIDLEYVSEFEVGSELGQLGTQIQISSDGPTGPHIIGDPDQGLVIADSVNKRLYFIDSQGNIRRTLAVGSGFGGRLELVDENQAIFSIYYGIGMYDMDGQERFFVHLFDVFTSRFRHRSYAYHDGVLFIHDSELKLWSIPEPTSSARENRTKLLNQDQTREYVEQRWGQSGEVQVDDQGRLFINGELVTRDLATWLEYKHGIQTRNQLVLVGSDQTGNVTWWQHGTFGVYIGNERFPRNFHYDRQLVPGSPGLDHSTGDLYFLGHPEDGKIALYRIKRDW